MSWVIVLGSLPLSLKSVKFGCGYNWEWFCQNGNNSSISYPFHLKLWQKTFLHISIGGSEKYRNRFYISLVITYNGYSGDDITASKKTLDPNEVVLCIVGRIIHLSGSIFVHFCKFHCFNVLKWLMWWMIDVVEWLMRTVWAVPVRLNVGYWYPITSTVGL